MRTSGGLAFLAGLSLSFTTACSKPVDLTKGLQVDVVSTGWFDVGIVEGKNKLVPTISVRLKNNSDQTLSTLQLNAVFRRAGEKDEWGSRFLPVVGSQGLKPGATTDAIALKSQLGYTGTEPRLDMLKNSLFVDARVELFAKYGSAQWVKVGEYPIARQLIAS